MIELRDYFVIDFCEPKLVKATLTDFIKIFSVTESEEQKEAVKLAEEILADIDENDVLHQYRNDAEPRIKYNLAAALNGFQMALYKYVKDKIKENDDAPTIKCRITAVVASQLAQVISVWASNCFALRSKK